MLGEIKGYCNLKSLDDVFIGYNKIFDPKGFEEIERDLLKAQYLRVIDVAVDGNGLLVLSPKGNALCDIRDMKSVNSYVAMEDFFGVLLPVGLSFGDKILESTKRLQRKGGYNRILRQMVIINSLRLGKFDDGFLFSKL